MTAEVGRIPTTPSRTRRVATTVTAAIGMVTTAAVAVQIGLAAYGVFGGGFSSHVTLGYVIALLTLLLLVAALLARPGRTYVLVAVVLFVLAGPVQPLLGSLGHTSPWVGALHGLNAAVIFGLAVKLVMARNPEKYEGGGAR